MRLGITPVLLALVACQGGGVDTNSGADCGCGFDYCDPDADVALCSEPDATAALVQAMEVGRICGGYSFSYCTQVLRETPTSGGTLVVPLDASIICCVPELP